MIKLIKVFENILTNEKEINTFLRKTNGKIVVYSPKVIVEYDEQVLSLEKSEFRHAYYNPKGWNLEVELYDGRKILNDAIEIYISDNRILGVDSFGKILDVKLGKKHISMDGILVARVIFVGDLILEDEKQCRNKFEQVQARINDMKEKLLSVEYYKDKTLVRKQDTDYDTEYRKKVNEILNHSINCSEDIESVYNNIRKAVYSKKGFFSASDGVEYIFNGKWYSEEVANAVDKLLELNDELLYLLSEYNDFSMEEYNSPTQIVSRILRYIDKDSEEKITKYSNTIIEYMLMKK